MARQATIERKTKETEIQVLLDLDGTGRVTVNTGVGFLDHMLESFAVHGGFDLSVNCMGDLDVDVHHSAEDIGIVLGQAFAKALGEKTGIARYGSFTLPMDEALAQADIDLSGRAYFVWDAVFAAEKIGALDVQMLPEFFRAFATNAQLTLHLRVLYGDNDHHKAEALFKAFAHALRIAVARGGDALLTTKGVI
ncbi:imidazoleglycerol-phosphate dehydratase [Clostridia bacterium]|nr:imidazoleglycerol-phosphate dehydratase [Clostridia bacterium]